MGSGGVVTTGLLEELTSRSISSAGVEVGVSVEVGGVVVGAAAAGGAGGAGGARTVVGAPASSSDWFKSPARDSTTKHTELPASRITSTAA